MSKYNDKEIAEIVDSEGLWYAITSYLNSGDIENPELAELWAQAETILSKIDDILGT